MAPRPLPPHLPPRAVMRTCIYPGVALPISFQLTNFQKFRRKAYPVSGSVSENCSSVSVSVCRNDRNKIQCIFAPSAVYFAPSGPQSLCLEADALFRVSLSVVHKHYTKAVSYLRKSLIGQHLTSFPSKS